MDTGVYMRSIDGDLVPLQVAEKYSSADEAEEIFRKSAKLICQEWHYRNKNSDENINIWLQETIYIFVGANITFGHQKIFRRIFWEDGRKRRGPKGKLNIFHHGIMAIFSEEKGIMDDRQRDFYAKRLLFSYRHYVPHFFLIGFLHQAWSKASREDVSTYIDRDFDYWIIFERLQDSAAHLRGIYPDDLEDTINRVRNVMPAIADHYPRYLRHRKNNFKDELYIEPWD